MSHSTVAPLIPHFQQNKTIITLGHGGGGQLTQQLLDDIFRPAFHNALLDQQHDSTLVNLPNTSIAVSTDSYVVDPIFYPNGNIGELAIIGTCNDLAMRGAKPSYITCGFILAEGLRIETLQAVVLSMAKTAKENNVSIIAGDIKVVEQSQSSGLYINTTGIGMCFNHNAIAPSFIEPDDAILISHDIGRHGLAVLAARENLSLTPAITSDCRPLWPFVECLQKSFIPIHCLRDLTRGGLAAALVELANTSKMDIHIKQTTVPIQPNVQAGCDLLGLDPLFVANEGCMIIILPQKHASDALAILQKLTANSATQIGSVKASLRHSPQVILETAYGTQRGLQLFSGEQLPRIC